MRAHRMSPKIPASVMPMASTTAMHPAGMASMAVRVEIGDDQDSGVARSSRAGTKRSVKADPTSRGRPGLRGRAPRIQTLRRPFFNRTVVMVAVVTRERILIASGVKDIEKTGSGELDWRGASCGARAARQGRDKHVLLSENACHGSAASPTPPFAQWRQRYRGRVRARD